MVENENYKIKKIIEFIVTNEVEINESVQYRIEKEQYLFEGSELNQTSDWDNIIKRTLLDIIIERFGSYENEENHFKFERNQKSVSTTTKRPDFALMYKKQIVFYGEEKSNSRDYNEALDQIKDNAGGFSKAPFLVCYVAGGKDFGLYIYKNENEFNKNEINNFEKFDKIFEYLDLKELNGRKKAVQMIYNIFEILLSIKDENFVLTKFDLAYAAVKENLKYWTNKSANLFHSEKEESIEVFRYKIFLNLLQSIDPSLKKLQKFISENNVENRIYDTNIQTFLECLQLADSHFESDSTNIFHTFSNPKFWREWAILYCKLNSLGNCFIDYYVIYRNVAFCNPVGQKLSENQAQRDYNEFLKISETSKYPHITSSSKLFMDFVMVTLKFIELNAYSVNQLRDFVNSFCDSKPEKEINIARDYLLNIRFREKYKLRYINEDQCRQLLVHFYGIHWIRLNSDLFQNLLRSFYPVFSKELLTELNKFQVSESLENCKNSSDILPFKNGIFVFTIELSKLTAILKKNERVSIYTNKYVENLKILNIAKLDRFNYRDGSLLEELNDEKYIGFTVFRNYVEDDQVIEPINQKFEFQDYINEYETTNFLSLNNTQRYGKEFCHFIFSLFGELSGNNDHCLVMYCSHIEIFLWIMCSITVILTHTETKHCLKLNGRGRSEFISFLKNSFGESLYITSLEDLYTIICSDSKIYEYDSIFSASVSENNVKTNKPFVDDSSLIKRGFVYYILDLVHVFDFASLNYFSYTRNTIPRNTNDYRYLTFNEHINSIQPNLVNMMEISNLEDFDKVQPNVSNEYVKKSNINEIMDQVINDILDNKRVIAKLKPKLDKNWRDIVSEDLLDKNKFMSLFI